MYKCPKCSSERFIAPATVIQLWEVDSSGDFVEVINDCLDVDRRPSKADYWNCAQCDEKITLG